MNPAPRRSERATSRARLESENLELTSNIEAFEEGDMINSLDDLKDYFRTSSNSSFILIDEMSSEKLVFVKFNQELPPQVVKSVIVFQDLSFKAFGGSHELKSSVYETAMQFSKKIVRFSDFLNLLVYVGNHVSEDTPLFEALEILHSHIESANISSVKAQKLMFLCEQLEFLCNPNKSFSTNLLTLGILWKAHSTSCYKTILSDNVLTLPSLRTLRRISQNFSHLESDTLRYLSLRVESLNSYERSVILMFDEIYVYQSLEYDSGRFVGLSTNDRLPATTILCFMIKSLCAKYSDIVACIPIHHLTVDSLRINCMKVLKTVMDAGFFVAALCADNHAVNRSFYTSLTSNINSFCNNPCDPAQKLYLLIDPVHTIKNLYNNFQKRVTFQFPDSSDINSANFNHVKALYDFECSMSIRMAHKLNNTVLHPSNIQRTSAKLCFALFCDSTVAALEFHSNHDHPEWEQTAKFLRYVTDLVKMLNIRTKSVGFATRDPLKLPFYSVTDERLSKFKDYVNFFLSWRLSKLPGFSKETFIAIENVCSVIPQIICDLLNEHNFAFVLPGTLQSDPLESRFGRYRQMSGGNFFISVKQIIESEKKIKLASLLKHSGVSLDRITASDDVIDEHDANVFDLDFSADFEMSEPELQIVYFVAGYCARRLTDKLHCEDCRGTIICDVNLPFADAPTDFFQSLNRGGLKAPGNELYILLCTAYEIFCKIKMSPHFDEFLRLKNPRDSYVSTVMCFVKEKNCVPNQCQSDHDLIPHFRRAVFVFFNCLARNFLRNLNFKTTKTDEKKIRKLRSTK